MKLELKNFFEDIDMDISGVMVISMKMDLMDISGLQQNIQRLIPLPAQ